MRIPSFKSKELIRIFQAQGFVVDHQSGSHVTIRHPDGRRTVIPLHNRDLKRGTLFGIIKQAGYSMKDFLGIL